MEICSHAECTGCFACISICPHKCISMYEDAYGEIHPIIDENNCIQCNACVKICPNNKEITRKWPQKCYASWITNNDKRRKCASGGIGTILSEFVIKHKNGVVFGTAYDEEFTPRITYTEVLEGIELFKGSKYVQSIVGEETYCEVKKFLADKRFVLFIGTPCQVAGLKSFLKREYENLITVDLICHGVSPTVYFKDEIAYLTGKYNIKDLCDIRFRGNDGNNFSLSLWRKLKGAEMRCYRGYTYSDYYLGGFLLGVTLRENCYGCKYARPERISDITIGDFIGLGKEMPFPYSKDNVSSVTLNTDSALSFFRELSEKMPEIVNIERQYSERLKYKPSLVSPFEKHPLATPFRQAYLEGGYLYASRKVLTPMVKKTKRKQIANKIKRIILLPFKVIRKMINT